MLSTNKSRMHHEEQQKLMCSESMVALQFLNFDFGPYMHATASSNVSVAAQTAPSVWQVDCIITAVEKRQVAQHISLTFRG